MDSHEAFRAHDGHEGGVGLDRRGFLQCLTWAGTGLVWAASGGVLSSRALAQTGATPGTDAAWSFVQISDTHVGFKGTANPDAMSTLQETIARINALPTPPAFVLHTGDLTHGQKAGAFDTLAEALKGIRTDRILFVPGENDVFLDGGVEYLERHGRGTTGRGWQSFDYRGVHFIGLVNVLEYKANGLGTLGDEQIEWLEKDVAGLGSSTPVVVFTHVPLWAVYPKWGWVTADAERALAYLRRFGSVTVLNGHIHQVMQKVEGRIAFHTARSTAFPQPAPGAAAGPGPMKVTEGPVTRMLGLREVTIVPGGAPLAVVDSTLA